MSAAGPARYPGRIPCRRSRRHYEEIFAQLLDRPRRPAAAADAARLFGRTRRGARRIFDRRNRRRAQRDAGIGAHRDPRLPVPISNAPYAIGLALLAIAGLLGLTVAAAVTSGLGPPGAAGCSPGNHRR